MTTRRLQYDRLLREVTRYSTADRSRIAGELSTVYETIEHDHILTADSEAVDSRRPLMSGAVDSYENSANAGDDDAQDEPEEASTGSSSIGKYRRFAS